MAKVYINIHSGPELKNKATLGLLVAVNAQKKGHDVRVFFAADGVHLMNCKEKEEIVGQGTGDVKEHLDHLRETNTKIYAHKITHHTPTPRKSILERQQTLRWTK